MIDSSYILWWILCAIIGGAIGHTKEQVSAGVILGALLGPLGVIITLFLSNPADQRAIDEHRANMRERLREQRQQNLEARQQQALESEIAFVQTLNQMRLQNQQAPTPRVLSRGPVAQYVPPPPMAKAAIQSFRIASNGQELGEIALPVIRTMMSAGRLLDTDHYFDPIANEWRTLDQL